MPSNIANEINLCRCHSIARIEVGDLKYKIFAKEKSREICSPQKSRNIRVAKVNYIYRFKNNKLGLSQNLQLCCKLKVNLRKTVQVT